MAKIDAFLKLMHEQKASDLHLTSGSQPILRINGELHRVKYQVLDNDELKAMLYEIAPEDKIKLFEETGDVEMSILAMNFLVLLDTVSISLCKNMELVRSLEKFQVESFLQKN